MASAMHDQDCDVQLTEILTQNQFDLYLDAKNTDPQTGPSKFATSESTKQEMKTRITPSNLVERTDPPPESKQEADFLALLTQEQRNSYNAHKSKPTLTDVMEDTLSVKEYKIFEEVHQQQMRNEALKDSACSQTTKLPYSQITRHNSEINGFNSTSDNYTVHSETMDSTYTMEESVRDDDDLRVLLLGEAGVGKSTMINAFSNYLKYSSYEEAKASTLEVLVAGSFILMDEEMNSKSFDLVVTDETRSKTLTGYKKLTAYQIPLNGFTKKSITFIDTPGFGSDSDASVAEFEEALNFDKTGNFDAVLILLNPNMARLTQMLEMFLSKVLDNCPKDKIYFCFTNSQLTMYRFGESFSTLRSFLKKKSDPIGNLADRSFCFENDSFKFLKVMKVPSFKLEEFQTRGLENSWNHSSSTMIRLLNKIESTIIFTKEDTEEPSNPLTPNEKERKSSQSKTDGQPLKTGCVLHQNITEKKKKDIESVNYNSRQNPASLVEPANSNQREIISQSDINQILHNIQDKESHEEEKPCHLNRDKNSKNEDTSHLSRQGSGKQYKKGAHDKRTARSKSRPRLPDVDKQHQTASREPVNHVSAENNQPGSSNEAKKYSVTKSYLDADSEDWEKVETVTFEVYGDKDREFVVHELVQHKEHLSHSYYTSIDVNADVRNRTILITFMAQTQDYIDRAYSYVRSLIRSRGKIETTCTDDKYWRSITSTDHSGFSAASKAPINTVSGNLITQGRQTVVVEKNTVVMNTFTNRYDTKETLTSTQRVEKEMTEYFTFELERDDDKLVGNYINGRNTGIDVKYYEHNFQTRIWSRTISRNLSIELTCSDEDNLLLSEQCILQYLQVLTRYNKSCSVGKKHAWKNYSDKEKLNFQRELQVIIHEVKNKATVKLSSFEQQSCHKYISSISQKFYLENITIFSPKRLSSVL